MTTNRTRFRAPWGKLLTGVSAGVTALVIRNKLIRVGAVVLKNARRIRLQLSSACAHQDLFAPAVARLE